MFVLSASAGTWNDHGGALLAWHEGPGIGALTFFLARIERRDAEIAMIRELARETEDDRISVLTRIAAGPSDDVLSLTCTGDVGTPRRGLHAARGPRRTDGAVRAAVV